MITIKSDEEIKIMREAGLITARILEEIKKAIAPGVTTGELDRMAEGLIRKEGAEPLFKGYRGKSRRPFPASITVSVNEEVVHGIPGKRKLCSGDIVSIDMGVSWRGFCGDSAFTAAIGDVDKRSKKLLDVTREALYKGIEKAMAGNRLTDISSAVQAHVEKNGFSVVRDLVGHGIGRQMHEEPQIPNFGPPGFGPLLERGMVLAIEPMVNMGGYKVRFLSDDWTVVTADKSISAHFEHTVAVSENGPVILTQQ